MQSIYYNDMASILASVIDAEVTKTAASFFALKAWDSYWHSIFSYYSCNK